MRRSFIFVYMAALSLGSLAGLQQAAAPGKRYE